MKALLHNRNFVFLWLAQIMTGLGDVLYQVGVMVIIYERTGSALQTAVVGVASNLPPFLLGPLAGVLVDRYPRRTVILCMDALRAGLVALLFLFISQQAVNLWGIYLVVSGLTAARTFHLPARLAIIPSLVRRQELVPANSLILATTQGTLAIGYALGGVLVLQLGFQTLVWINVLTFVSGACLVSLIRLAPAPRPRGDHELHIPTIPMWTSIRDGVTYLRRHALARPLVVMELLEHIPHGVWTAALMLVFVEQALGGQATDWGYQNGAFYGGQLLGAIIATLLARRMARQPGWVIISNAFLFGLLTLIYALSPHNLFAIIVAFIFGPPSSMRDVAQDSLLQASVDEKMMGRVYALRNMFAHVNFLMAGLLFAWLADATIPIRWIYIMAAVMYFGTAVYALSSRALRQSQIGEARVLVGN